MFRNVYALKIIFAQTGRHINLTNRNHHGKEKGSEEEDNKEGREEESSKEARLVVYLLRQVKRGTSRFTAGFSFFCYSVA
ncbi:MAG: hypothetical protein WC887_01440 [Candidatus Paceibacterota bacterium]|jgi:hypothetical protein